jgi:Icc-related predicted phosphoesterase
MPRLVFISDTHNQHDAIQLPDGDIIIHAGDFSYYGKPKEVIAFGNWYGSLKQYKHRVLVPGNHDFLLQEKTTTALGYLPNIEVLIDRKITLMDLAIYGSPWQPIFCDWAFNVDEVARYEKFKFIPNDLDILVTHTPAYGILDLTDSNEEVGCQVLRDQIVEKAPKIHVFGHIHEAYGINQTSSLLSINAATCNFKYKPVNKPIVVDYDGKTATVVS